MREAGRADRSAFRPARSASLLALAMVLGSSVALAHMGAKGVVKERMDLMSGMGKAMKTLSVEARSNGAFDGADTAKIARGLERHASRISELFPKGSGRPPSEARPEIWSNWRSFTRIAASLKEETAKLAAVAGNGDRAAFAEQLRSVGRVCSACHKDFRAKRKRH